MINLLFNKPLKKIKKKDIIFNNDLTKKEWYQLNKLFKEFEDIINSDEKPKLRRTGIIKYDIKLLKILLKVDLT